MFELTEDEFTALRTQFAISNKRGGMRYRPFVFTEQGVAMLATVLNSSRAIQMNIAIMRAFVRLREILSSHNELAAKLKELENRVEKHDEHIHTLFSAIRQLMEPPEKPKREIGFRIKEPAAKYGVKRQKITGLHFRPPRPDSIFRCNRDTPPHMRRGSAKRRGIGFTHFFPIGLLAIRFINLSTQRLIVSISHRLIYP